MRKVTKILGMIVSTAILLLILTPIFASMMLSLPFVQNKILRLAENLASEYLMTEVSMRRIDVTTTGDVEISDFLVRDMDADTLLYVKRLESSLVGYSNTNRRLSLGVSTISGGVLNLRQTERGGMNIREITDKLASKGSGGKTLVIFASSVELSQMTLRIEQLAHQDPSYGVDVKDIELNDLAGRVRSLTIDGSAIHAFVDAFSAREKSGFEVQQIKGELYLTQGAFVMQGMNITTQWSSITMPYFMLTGVTWADYKDFNNNTDISLRISDGYLSSDDVAYFSPSMKSYGVVLHGLDLSVSGEVSRMVAEIANISYGESTFISAKAELDGLPAMDELVSSIKIGGVTTTQEDISLLNASLGGAEFSPSVSRMLRDLGRVTLRGVVSGERGLQDMNLAVALESDLGEVSTSMRVGIENGVGVVLDGDLSAHEFDAGVLLGEQKLGRVSFRSGISGSVPRGVGAAANYDITLNNNIFALRYNDYTYRGIDLLTRMCGADVSGDLTINDPNLKMVMQAIGSDVELGGASGRVGEQSEDRVPNYTTSIDIQHANLKALGLNVRDSTSVLTARLTAAAMGRDVEDSSLRVELIHGSYIHNSKEIATSGAVLEAFSVEGERRVTLSSEYVDVEFESTSRVAALLGYMKGAISDYLPALYNKPYFVRREFANRLKGGSDSLSLRDPISRLKVTTHDLNSIMGAVAEGLEVAEGSELELVFDDRNHFFDLNMRSEFMERKAILALDFTTHITNRGDSLTLQSKFGELYLGTSQIRDAEILAGARRNDIEVRSNFDNPLDSITAQLAVRMQLRKQGDGVAVRREMSAEILPSRVVRRGREWSLGSNRINISHRGVKIDDFVAKSLDQSLSINGYASRSTQDTLSMDLKSFDLSILSSLISQVGYSVEGRTSGDFAISSALDSARLSGEMELDSVSVNNIKAPAMNMAVSWDSKLNQARLILENRASRDTLIRGYYIPSQVKYYARCEVDSLNMGLLDPPLGGVIDSTGGYAHLNLTLTGQRRDAVLSGEIEIEDFATTVDYTGVRYTIPSARVEVSNNRLQTLGARVEDETGGKGKLDVDVSLQHLSNIGYSLRIYDLDKMLVLNTTEQDNDTFYGRVFGAGMAQIRGDRSGVRMNITASSDGDSHFYMPLARAGKVSTADFISFVAPKDDAQQDGVLARRRRNFEQRRERSSGQMVINMSLNVNPDTEVQLVIDPTVGDIIKARGEGQLNLSLEPKVNRFEIYGDYTISEGSYLFTLQNIVNKRFVINPGSSIQWTGSPIDARLNIDAIYKLKASLQPLVAEESTRAVPVDCIIQLTDRLTQPDVAFSIELPSSDGETQAMVNNLLNDQETISRQFFYLMLANSFIPESSGGGSDLGASAGAATGFELLTNQLSNWLSTSDYNVIIRYRPESELTGEELDFGFSKGLINNRLLVELEGNYVSDNEQNTLSENASNFMGEAYITWLIDRAGALRVKGFTQTIDRFDENQGLQETGVGLYYRESFNNFADLRERVRARFSASDERLAKRKRRREEREERRRAREVAAAERDRRREAKRMNRA